MATIIPEENQRAMPKDHEAAYKDAEPGATIDHPAIRPQALHEANRLHSAFFGHPLASPTNPNSASSPKKKPSPKNERLCMGGHRETIFGLSFSPDGKYMASASQDSSVCIWDVKTHRLVAKLTDEIDAEFECLRVAWMEPTRNNDVIPTSAAEEDEYLLASAGADGIVRLFSGITSGVDGDKKMTWQSAGTMDHFLLNKGDNSNDGGEKKKEDRPQIYALQFLQSKVAPEKNLLLTSADGCIYLWNIVEDTTSPQSPLSDDTTTAKRRKSFLLYQSVRFGHLNDGTRVYKFGGSRNPDNDLFVFDASYSQSNDLMGVALSDGTCRVLSLVKGNGDPNDPNYNESIFQEECVLSLPSGYFPGMRGGHLTALSWDKSGTRLATCIASGRVVLWSLQVVADGYGAWMLHPSCISIMEGGHDIGRPLFGAKYWGGDNQELLMTWGVDGKVCVWDSYSVGDVISPLCILVSHSNYPIYALDVTGGETNTSDKGSELQEQRTHIGLAGGSDGGFLGVPVYLYDV